MAGRVVVRPDKNEFLLYSMLNALDQMRGTPDDHFLKRKTVNHFEEYEGLGLKMEDYWHHSKPVSYVLTINEAPDFSEKDCLGYMTASMKDDVMRGRSVLPELKHFYSSTDFEDFYQSILPRYEEECEFLQGMLDRSGLMGILADAWERDDPFDMEVIPMPLEQEYAGIGPGIGDTIYSVIGPPFSRTILFRCAHEASHPLLKRILEPIMGEIEKRSHLLERAVNHPNYPESYRYWPTCFEEHFIRTVQTGYINPLIDPETDIDYRLGREERRDGMVYIWDFYEEIKNYKDGKTPEQNLQDVALRILERLDKK